MFVIYLKEVANIIRDVTKLRLYHLYYVFDADDNLKALENIFKLILRQSRNNTKYIDHLYIHGKYSKYGIRSW